MGSQPEQDKTVTATIKVAAFIYSSHTAAGVVKISIVWDKLQPLKDNYLYMHIKEYLQHLLFIYVTTNKQHQRWETKQDKTWYGKHNEQS